MVLIFLGECHVKLDALYGFFNHTDFILKILLLDDLVSHVDVADKQVDSLFLKHMK